MKDKQLLWVVALIALFVLVANPKGCPNNATQKVTAITYIYEKSTPIPNPVQAALDKIKRTNNIVTSIFEQPEPTEPIPAQHAVSLPAAKAAGLPALIVLANDKVLQIVKEPKTEDDVMNVLK